MSKSKERPEVAEKYINDVKKGVEGIYNRDAFFEERVEDHQQLADQISYLLIFMIEYMFSIFSGEFSIS